jgi:hypothetical protein
MWLVAARKEKCPLTSRVAAGEEVNVSWLESVTGWDDLQGYLSASGADHCGWGDFRTAPASSIGESCAIVFRR